MASAADYTTAVCLSGGVKFWQNTTETCDWQDADVQALVFFANGGGTPPCWTDETELNNALAAGTLKVLKIGVRGEMGDSTDVEKDISGYSCTPASIRTNKDNNFTFSVTYDIDNYNFWNDFSNDSGAAGVFGWVNQSGVLYIADGTPSIKVNQGRDNDLEVINGTVEWRGLNLPTPYPAVASVFRCS